jgi:hypothetical protein
MREKIYYREARGLNHQGTELFILRSIEPGDFFLAVAAAIAACGPAPELEVTITCREWRA